MIFELASRRIGKEDNLIYTLPKFNSSPLKNDGWKTILSFWDGIFSGAMLNFQGVHIYIPGNAAIVTFLGWFL